MTVSATWTVHCDWCGDWYAEESNKADAIKFARAVGFVRRRNPAIDQIDWLCPSCRSDVCGEKWPHMDTWCMQPPHHEGEHYQGVR